MSWLNARWLTAPWLTIRIQLLLGVIFVAAALPKIVDPPSFLHMMHNYRLVPQPLIAPLALGMPWIELLCGIALILGLWRRTSTVIIGLLLSIFIVAISINIARDNAVNCGCFSVADANKPHAELMDDMKLVVLRDVGMLALVAQLLWVEKRGRGGVLEAV